MPTLENYTSEPPEEEGPLAEFERLIDENPEFQRLMVSAMGASWQNTTGAREDASHLFREHTSASHTPRNPRDPRSSNETD